MKWCPCAGGAMELRKGTYVSTNADHPGPFGFFWRQYRGGESVRNLSDLCWYVIQQGKSRVTQVGFGDLNEVDLHRVALHLTPEQGWACITVTHFSTIDSARFDRGEHELTITELLRMVDYVVFRKSPVYVAEGNEPIRSFHPPMPRDELAAIIMRWWSSPE